MSKIGPIVVDETRVESVICFASFRLYPTQRILTEDGKPLRVGGRALDILITLVERQGEVVGKRELMERVWPNTFVEDDNLKVHVSALRRAIGHDNGARRYIVSIPGRGYSFVAPVTTERVDGEPKSATQKKRTHNLPPLPTRLIGRTSAVARLVQQINRRRMVTVV